MAAFDPKEMKRNRTLAWDPAANGGKGGAVTTSDLTNDNGTVNEGECKKFGVNPKDVTYITLSDIPGDYANGAKSACAKLALEWSTEKIKWTPDEVAHYLALSARLQDAANESVKAKRPVTDKAAERAYGTMLKVVKAQHPTLSDAEVKAKLAALGLKG